MQLEASVAFETHLLVDGSNILHAWPELKALLPRDREAAREKLAQHLRVVHDGEQIRVTLVHDGRGSELIVERPTQQPTFSVLFTPSSLTADDVIERLVSNSANPAKCVVASADRAIRQTIEAAGATWIPPADLAAWFERVERRSAQQVASLRRAADQKWQGRE